MELFSTDQRGKKQKQFLLRTRDDRLGVHEPIRILIGSINSL